MDFLQPQSVRVRLEHWIFDFFEIMLFSNLGCEKKKKKKKKPNHRDSFYVGCLNFFTNEEIIYMMGVLILNPCVILGIYIEKLVLCDKIEQCY